MKTEFAPRRLDVAAFAKAGTTISGQVLLRDLPRLSAETTGATPDAAVPWQARGEERPGASGAPAAWLHLAADALIPLVCQRCLAPVETKLAVDRWFRFVADEETAAREDEASEEDILVSSRDFDLQELLEDELLMEVPVTPRHEICPEPPRLSAVDDDFDATEKAKPNAFAVLGTLRPRKS
ncbi:MAG: YceD family protein [Burkholderiaceae bacterium]